MKNGLSFRNFLALLAIFITIIIATFGFLFNRVESIDGKYDSFYKNQSNILADISAIKQHEQDIDRRLLNIENQLRSANISVADVQYNVGELLRVLRVMNGLK